MNHKRWAAIGLALIVLFVSIIIPYIGSVLVTDDDEDQPGIFSQFLQDTAEERVIETGSPFERILVVDIRGQIISQPTSAFLLDGYNHEKTIESIENALHDDSIKAVILRVDTPGGGVYESAEITDRLKELQDTREIPVYTVMESMAASGGYYIAAGSDQIFATNQTLTGSIGVIMSGLNFTRLLDDLGIDDMTIKSGDLKDIGSMTREMTDEDARVLQTLVDSMYERFVDVIVEGRDLSREEVYQVADGRIFDGQQAQAAGLVDQIGYFQDALEHLRDTYDLEDAQVFTYHGRSGDFFTQLFMTADQMISFSRPTEKQLIDQHFKQDGFMYIYRGLLND